MVFTYRYRYILTEYYMVNSSCSGDTVDTEIKVPSAENTELQKVPSFKPGGQNLAF